MSGAYPISSCLTYGEIWSIQHSRKEQKKGAKPVALPHLLALASCERPHSLESSELPATAAAMTTVTITAAAAAAAAWLVFCFVNLDITTIKLSAIHF